MKNITIKQLVIPMCIIALGFGLALSMLRSPATVALVMSDPKLIELTRIIRVVLWILVSILWIWIILRARRQREFILTVKELWVLTISGFLLIPLLVLPVVAILGSGDLWLEGK